MTEVGLFVGLSSGAIMAGAVKCASLIDEGESATIVTIVCDDGWKYLSTGAWSDDIDDVVERAKKIIYF
jgi:cysteine synthase B